jgi:hypothetical protein
MANALNIELAGKVVILKQEAMADGYVATEHPFRVEDGFGTHTYTSGTKCSGTWLSDGEVGSIRGYSIERLATEDEITAAHGRAHRDNA